MATISQIVDAITEWLDSQSAICDAASEGLWVSSTWEEVCCRIEGKTQFGIAQTACGNDQANAQFICSARTNYPAMLNWVQEELKELIGPCIGDMSWYNGQRIRSLAKLILPPKQLQELGI